MKSMRINQGQLSAYLKKHPTASNQANLAIMQSQKQSEQANSLPDWLSKLIFDDDTLALSIATKNKELLNGSPHKLGLYAIGKNPKLYTSSKAEHYLQVALFYMLEKAYPVEYELAYAIPNGSLRSNGVAGQLKAEGQKSGYPDIAIDIALGGHFGFRLEVKTEKGKLRPVQREWEKRLSEGNYKTLVGYGFEECWGMISNYLSMPPTRAT